MFFVMFFALIFAVKFIDVKPIGPQSSEIGLATVNALVRDFVGVNLVWYDITDVFGLISIAVVGFFGLEGLFELVTRKSLKKMDIDIILLGVFYGIVICAYVLFEIVVINYRPMIMDGELEASFPSSHTMLVVSVMGTAIYQFSLRIQNNLLRKIIILACSAIMLLTIVGRLISGVHWFTDILGGVFLSGALIFLYIAVCKKAEK